MIARALRGACFVACIVGVAACDASVTDARPAPTDLQLVMLLADTGSVDSAATGLWATLAEVGTPSRAPFVQAERFELRRARDGALFDWRWTPTRDGFGAEPPADSAPGNYFLPRVGAGGRLGAGDIAPGERYLLVIDAGKRTMTGSVRVPARVEILSQTNRPQVTVIWRSDPAAGGYLLLAARDYRDYSVLSGVARDTVLEIDTVGFIYNPGLRPDGTIPLPITAVDSSYARYIRDPAGTSAGISGGYGVLGAFTRRYATVGPFGRR